MKILIVLIIAVIFLLIYWAKIGSDLRWDMKYSIWKNRPSYRDVQGVWPYNHRIAWNLEIQARKLRRERKKEKAEIVEIALTNWMEKRKISEIRHC